MLVTVDSPKIILISDTDSLLISITALTLEEIVKPELAEEWPAEAQKWFADETPASSKEPGLLKSEFECTTGIFWRVIKIIDS